VKINKINKIRIQQNYELKSRKGKLKRTRIKNTGRIAIY